MLKLECRCLKRWAIETVLSCRLPSSFSQSEQQQLIFHKSGRHVFLTSLSMPPLPRSARSGELRTQKLKSRVIRTHSLKVLPLKPGVSQYIAMHASLIARDFFPAISTLLVHSPAFFPKPLPIFPVLAVANTWFVSRPAEKIGHPARGRFPC